jgi:hypothetical protein
MDLAVFEIYKLSWCFLLGLNEVNIIDISDLDKLQTLQIIDRQRVVVRLTLESKKAPLVSRDTATLVVPFRFKKFSSYKPMHVLSTTVPSRHILLESYNHSKSERLI